MQEVVEVGTLQKIWKLGYKFLKNNFSKYLGKLLSRLVEEWEASLKLLEKCLEKWLNKGF